MKRFRMEGKQKIRRTRAVTIDLMPALGAFVGGAFAACFLIEWMFSPDAYMAASALSSLEADFRAPIYLAAVSFVLVGGTVGGVLGSAVRRLLRSRPSGGAAIPTCSVP